MIHIYSNGEAHFVRGPELVHHAIFKKLKKPLTIAGLRSRTSIVAFATFTLAFAFLLAAAFGFFAAILFWFGIRYIDEDESENDQCKYEPQSHIF
uniref:Uncharacterized protein n=1 Tax=Romanomermis culicivorax TaxID=13658 RepID=A0A915J894_ROMCU